MYYTMQEQNYSRNEHNNHNTNRKDVTDASGQMFGINSSELCSAEFEEPTTKEVGSIHNDIPNDFYHIMGRSLTMTQSDIIPISETIPISERVSSNTDEINDDDVNVLSGDNEVNVGIRPDIRDVRLQCCSCSFVINYNSK
jgi:hypothetical protein